MHCAAADREQRIKRRSGQVFPIVGAPFGLALTAPLLPFARGPQPERALMAWAAYTAVVGTYCAKPIAMVIGCACDIVAGGIIDVEIAIEERTARARLGRCRTLYIATLERDAFEERELAAFDLPGHLKQHAILPFLHETRPGYNPRRTAALLRRDIPAEELSTF